MKFIVKRLDRKLLAIMLLSAAAVLSVILCVLTMAAEIVVPKREFASLILYEGPKPVESSAIAAMEVDGHPVRLRHRSQQHPQLEKQLQPRFVYGSHHIF